MKNNTKKIAFLGLMLAVVIILSALEQMLPPLPLLPPNVKLGLSNIVTMYCLFFIGKSEAVILATLKSFFVFLMRGPMAGALSFCGGMLSIFVLITLIFVFRNKISYIAVSIAGALSHNIGQFVAISIIFGTGYLFYYLPVLIVSGILMGIVTGTLLKVVMPVLSQILEL